MLWKARFFIHELQNQGPENFVKSAMPVKYKLMALSTSARSLFKDMRMILELVHHCGMRRPSTPREFYERQRELLPDRPELRRANIRVCNSSAMLSIFLTTRT
ncbi:uncharacterized protein JCM6883_007582 [Sporobolomyces salmoneus]|uniref:uncharacterized protein n=1 Tax=Sporobolomyces salmoneus TaxID=183962 RepID=UPI0031782A3B